MDPSNNPSTNLLIAIVQAQDAEDANTALNRNNATNFQLPSVGGFLGIRNATLLIQSTGLLWNSVIQILKQTCKQRIEYRSIYTEGTMMAAGPFLAPVAVGGATVFSIEVERYEEV